MDDKRRSQRIEIILPAWFESSDQENVLSTATTINISATGLCLSCAEKLDLGKELPLQVTLPTGEKVTAAVRVMWVREVNPPPRAEYRIGVKILNPAGLNEKKLVEFYTLRLAAISDSLKSFQ